MIIVLFHWMVIYVFYIYILFIQLKSINFKIDCSHFILNNKECASNITKCDFIFDWLILNDEIEFTLKKFNFKLNEWNGFLFSFDNNNNKIIKESDLIIALMPENQPNRIINGYNFYFNINIYAIIIHHNYNLSIIKNGSDITISKDSNKNNIFNKTILFFDNYVEIKFKRKAMLNCANISIYLLNGEMSLNGTILYNDKTILSKPLGPFCLNSISCSESNKYELIKKQIFNDYLDDQISVEIEIKNNLVKSRIGLLNNYTTLHNSTNKYESDEYNSSFSLTTGSRLETSNLTNNENNLTTFITNSNNNTTTTAATTATTTTSTILPTSKGFILKSIFLLVKSFYLFKNFL